MEVRQIVDADGELTLLGDGEAGAHACDRLHDRRLHASVHDPPRRVVPLVDDERAANALRRDVRGVHRLQLEPDGGQERTRGRGEGVNGHDVSWGLGGHERPVRQLWRRTARGEAFRDHMAPAMRRPRRPGR